MTPILNVAQNAMLASGKKIFFLHNQLDSLSADQKSDKILAPKLKEMIEAEMIKELSLAFPTHQINSSSDSTVQNDEHQWYIAVNGIENMIRNFPFYGISIAYVYRNKPQVAIVYNAATEQAYSAIKGEGATFNNRRIRVEKPVENIKQAFVSVNLQKNPEAFLLQNKINSQVAAMRCLGVEALEICLVADGSLSGFIGDALDYRHIIAAQLIAAEAGAVAIDFSGRDCDRDSQNMITCGPKLLKSFVKLVN